jgi:hypothetical protein
MPGLNGQALQGSLVELGSTLPILFVTGYVDVTATEKAIKAGADIARRGWSLMRLGQTSALVFVFLVLIARGNRHGASGLRCPVGRLPVRHTCWETVGRHRREVAWVGFAEEH